MTFDEKQKLYNEAIAFYELAECGRQHIPEQKNVESYIPYVVNMSFCAELFLKMLLLEEGKTTIFLKDIKHNLWRLYSALSDECKNSIYTSYRQQNQIMIYSIEEELKKSQNVFVWWRYLVLDKAGNVSTKKKLASFEDSVNAKNSANKPSTDCNNKQNNSISPFFLKEFNEVLGEICKPYSDI